MGLFLTARSLLKNIPQNELHIHTRYSDGTNTVLEYVKAAIKKGFTTVCFTDHVDFSTTWFPAYKKEILGYKKKYKKDIEIYCGIEVRASNYSGSLNTHHEIVKETEIVMGVVHRYPDGAGGAYDIKSLTQKEALRLEYTTALGLLENTQIDILGHPGSTYEKNFSEFPKNLYLEIIKKAKKKGIAVELNPRYQRNFQSFLKLCLKVNPLVSIGSNAHSIQEMGAAVSVLEGYLSK